MPTWTRRISPNALRGADLALMAAAFLVALVASAHQGSPMEVTEFLAVRIKLSNLLLFVVFAAAWHLIFASCGLYRSHRIGQMAGEWWEIAKAVALGTALLSVAAVVLDVSAVTRTFLGSFGAAALLGTQGLRSGSRSLLRMVRRRGRNLRRVVIVGCGPRGAALGRAIWQRPELGYLLVGYIDDMPSPANPLHGRPERHLGPLAKVERLLQDGTIDEVFVTLPVKSFYETIAKVVSLGEQSGFIVRIPAEMFELRLAKANVDHLGGINLLTLETPRPTSAQLVVKRLIDIAGAGLVLAVLAPLLVAVAVVIRLDSRGAALFVQKRVGLGGHRFRLFKFRTMVVDAQARLAELEAHNEVDGAAFKMKNDPRVTRLGRILRRFSIDELPQFFNVLTGDMSLVGPRPLPVRDVERFDAPWLHRRFTVKPGLTCLWQVNGRHDVDFQHWMELDLQYVDHWSLSLDWHILARTMPAVLRGVGAS